MVGAASSHVLGSLTQIKEWKCPDERRTKKARQNRSDVKSMLIIFLIVRVLCTTNLLQEVR